MPVLLDCNFIVDSTNPDGVRSLKGPGIEAVYMHTGTTPSAENPNPAAGYAVIKFQDNYKRLFGVYGGTVSPTSGSSLLVASAGLSVGAVYVITILGTTSTAQWNALGVPVGTTPAVGVAFVAKATSATGTGAVQLPLATGAGVLVADVIGNTNLQLNSSLPNIAGQQSGSYAIVRFLGATNSSTTTLVAKAPANETVVQLSFYLSNSKIQVQGE